MARPRSLLTVGRVTKPHGLRGLLKVKAYASDSDSLLAVKHVWLELGDETVPFAVRTVRRDRHWFLLGLEGCFDRDTAEKWRGAEVLVDRRELPALQGDEFYLADCMGKPVRLEDGTHMGKVTGVLPTGAQDLLVVEEADRELLVPAGPPFLLDVTEECVILADSARELPTAANRS